MIRLTVEEMNLLSIYHEGSKAQLMENMTAALPFMDEDMRPFAERTLQKISPLTENEYAELAISPLMKYDRGKRLTPPQSRKVNSLVKKECCNCERGHCILLDDGEECLPAAYFLFAFMQVVSNCRTSS